MKSSEQNDSIVAAEYALGTLSPAARAAAERRIEGGDGAFVRQVEAWRKRFADFDEVTAPMAADAALWRRIEQGLDMQKSSQSGKRPGFRDRFRDAWENIRFWRAVGFAGTAAAMLLAVVAATTTIQSRRELATLADRKPVFVAVLVNDASKEAGAVVNAFANGRVELIPLTSMDVPPGRALQIWTLWDRAVGPRSVGLIERPHTTPLNLDSLPPTGPDQLFEITLEPVGGSPTGRPTGPILFKGMTARAL